MTDLANWNLNRLSIGRYLPVAVIFRGLEARFADKVLARTPQDVVSTLQARPLKNHFAADHEEHVIWLFIRLAKALSIECLNLFAGGKQNFGEAVRGVLL